MRVRWLALGLGCLIPASAMAGSPQRPVVVELFTSQGCSSCPPADVIVAELARTRPDLLPLTFHVTYWNSLGWQDPFSLEAATDRQRRYVALSVSPEVYTPAMVIDGTQDVIGSDRPAVEAALAQATAEARRAAPVDIVRHGSTLTVTVGEGAGQGRVLLIGYDRGHDTQVGRGENRGRLLHEANVVRSIAPAGVWAGHAVELHAEAPVGEAVAVIVQAADGHILAAGRLAPPVS